MQPRSLSRLSGLRGFTLVELMIVVVIASILLSIAVPSYISSIRKSRRADAKTAVLELAGREERYLTTNPANYSTLPADLGVPGFGAGFPVGTGGYYTATVCVTQAGNASNCPPSNLAGPAFLITATPIAGTSQAGDTQCVSFSVDSGGQQFVGAASTLTAPQCWQQ